MFVLPFQSNQWPITKIRRIMDWGLIPPSLPPSPLFAPRGLLLGATSPLLLPSFPLFWTGDKSPAGETSAGCFTVTTETTRKQRKQPAGCFRCFRCYQDGRFGRARFDGVFIGERAENNLMPLLTPISIPLLLLTDTLRQLLCRPSLEMMSFLS